MTTTGLLQSLGLRAPAHTNAGGTPPTTAKGPTGPLKRPNDDPHDEQRAPEKSKGSGSGNGNGAGQAGGGSGGDLKPLTDEQLQKILSSLPNEPLKRTEVVADAVTRISDIARRDPIARGLRDWLAKKQPFTSDANARKKLDEGIKDLVDKGIKAGLLALVSGLVGQEPGEMDRDKKAKDPITMPGKDPDEHIGKSPEIDLPFDKPGAVKRTNFEFQNVPDSVAGGKHFSFKLRTPTNFKPGKSGAAYVAISSKADFDAKSPHRESDVKFDSKGELSLSIVAPLDAGRYVMYVVVGPGREDRPVHEFDVTVKTSGAKAQADDGDAPNPPEKPPQKSPEKAPLAPTKNGALSDSDLKDKLKALPTHPPQRVEALAELVTKLGDAAKRDPIVKALRDLIVKIQPVMPDAEAKKTINDAISDLVGKGVMEGIKALLEAAAGKSAQKVDPNAPPRYGPDVKEKDLKVQKLETPPIPFDTPPKTQRNSFELVGLSKKVKPTNYFNFKLRTPAWWEPRSRLGAGWVVIATKEDFDKSGAHADRVRAVQIEHQGELALSLSAPDAPGRYIVFIVVGSDAEHDPTFEFEVAK